MSCDQALDKLSEKLNSGLLVQEEHGFQKGAQCAPPGRRSSKKPGLDRVKHVRLPLKRKQPQTGSAAVFEDEDGNPFEGIDWGKLHEVL